MSNWTTITAEDLKDTKVARLVEALQSAALGDGQFDPTDAIIADVVARIRAEIASCSTNQLDANTNTIPKDLHRLACRMVVRELQSRLQDPLGEDEREEQRNDLRYLERIAKCEVVVAQPDTPGESEVQQKGGVTVASTRTARATREEMEGL